MNKKLYIPTTTLNFNNILSSESVSPKAFYPLRSFGYPRWIPIAENPFENSIILYEYCCSFDIPKSNFENHPLLIEITMNELEQKYLKNVSKGIYLYDQTIYLDPWNTKFIFFSEDERKITLSMSESSFETKLIRLYEKKMIVEKPVHVYSTIQIKDVDTINKQAIEKDYQFNKMKGLFFGYYIGALFATTKDSLKKMNVLRDIKNTFAAILSGFNNEATTIQLGNLNRYLDFLLKDTSLFKRIVNLTNNEVLTTEIIKEIISDYGHIENIESLNNLLRKLKDEKVNDNKNASIEWIDSLISIQKQLMSKENKPVSTSYGEIVIQNYHIHFISDSLFVEKKYKELYLFLIDKVLCSHQYNGKISSFKKSFADDITINAKAFYGKEWDNSSAKMILNSLRRHISGEEFIYDWNNSLFSSIASIVKNGDDWHNLLRYMQTHEQNDYRLTFSMYGCLNGFANLTREFTDCLFNKDSKYVAEVYKEYYKQFLGKELDINKSSEIKGLEDAIKKVTDYGYSNIPEDLKIIFNNNDFNGLSKDAQIYYINEIQKLYLGKIDKRFITLIKNLTYPKTKTIWKKIVKRLESLINNRESQNKINSMERSLFTKVFLDDFEYLQSNKDFRGLVRNISDWEEDLKWFIEAHNSTHEDNKFYKDKSKDNKTVIKQFVFFKKQKYKCTEDFLRRTYL